MPKCILIADDSSLLRISLKEFLEVELGFKVCGEAVDGIDALEQVVRLKPDLVLLDFSMPRMNGLQTAREMRGMQIDAPIILFTMHSNQVLSEQAYKLGIDAVVPKADLVGLQTEIERVLQIA